MNALTAVHVLTARPAVRAGAGVATPGVGDRINAIASGLEAQFVAAGQQLELAIDGLGGLTRDFETLSGVLESSGMREAAADLSLVVQRLGGMNDGADGGDDALLSRMIALVGNGLEYIGRIGQSMRMIVALVVNARIAAAALQGGDSDFASFANQISRSIAVSQQNLDDLTGAMQALERRLRAAHGVHAAVESRWQAVLTGMPARMTADLRQIEARRQGVQTAALEVGGLVRDLRQTVGAAVMALQVGDSSRQRLEHVVAALAMASPVLQPGLAPLQAAQLQDTAHEHEQHVTALDAALEGLARDAARIVETGARSLDIGDGGDTSFMADLERDVREADTVLRDIGQARGEAETVLDAVMTAVGHLERYVSVVQSFDADMRIMALNAGLKAARLGDEGRALSSIALTLRQCSQATAAESTQAMAAIRDLAGIAAQRRSASASQKAMADLQAAMNRSLANLREACLVVDGLLRGLRHDSAAISAFIGDARCQLAGQDLHVAEMRAAARALDDVAGIGADADASMIEADADASAMTALLAAVAALYTMGREREVHRTVTGSAVGTGLAVGGDPDDRAEVAAAGPVQDLDDMLF
ncbi:hypothetical protein [Parapedomonas caeni]